MEIFDTGRTLLATLGYPLFEPVAHLPGPAAAELFYCRRAGTDARGEYTSEGFVVLKGSKGLFEASITKVAFQRGALLHAYAYRFIEIFAPHLAALDLREAALSRLSLREPRRKQSAELRIPAYGEPLLAPVDA